jgi:hypothetical protein
LKTGAIQFYARGVKGGETFGVGFVTAPRKNKSYNTEMAGGAVPLSTYLDLTPQWQLVTIPLLDFPQTAQVLEVAIGEPVQTPFRWHIVQTVYFDVRPGPDPFVEFQVTNIRIVPTYDPAAVRKK